MAASYGASGKKSFIVGGGGVTTRSGTFNLLWVVSPDHRQPEKSHGAPVYWDFSGNERHKSQQLQLNATHEPPTAFTVHSDSEGGVTDFDASPTRIGGVQLIRVFYGALGHE